MSSRPTIYVVDDDQAVRSSLRWLLESVGHRVETFASGSQFLESYRPDQPGCLLLDVRMPGLSGLELQEKLSGMRCTIPIIIITGHGDVPMAVRAMKAGAMDFIEKPFNDQALLEQIHHCLAQDAKTRETSRTQRALLERAESLTPREREVLERVIRGRPNKVIASELAISSKTVEAHRANVMEKMDAHSLAELVSMCISCGLYKGKP